VQLGDEARELLLGRGEDRPGPVQSGLRQSKQTRTQTHAEQRGKEARSGGGSRLVPGPRCGGPCIRGARLRAQPGWP
jgi:hypothetical protein